MATLQDYAGDDLDKLRQQMAGGGAAPTAPDAAPAPSPAAAALANPAFADFVSRRANELQAAQDQANKNQRMADLANAGVKVSAALEGKDPDKALLDANQQRAQLPVAQALQRQAGADAATKDFGAQQDITTKGNAAAWDQAKRDPNSPVSKTIQGIYAPILGPAAAHLTAADAEAASAGGQLQVSKLAEIARAKQAQAELARQTAANAESARHNKADEGLRQQELGVQGQRLAQELSQKGRVPEQEAAKIVNQAQALKAIDELERLHGDVGASAMVPGVNFGASGRYADAVGANLPAIVAGALPQGRETPGAMEEFKKIVPSPIVPKERAKAAFDQLRQRVKENAAAQISALRAGGYKPEQIDELSRQASPPAAPAPAPKSAAPTHYLISPDRKTRIPADVSGKPLGPAEPNPNG